MIFKPSSLHKLFFTYICPRFYGGAPAAPSNTTSTSTVNQSPWQNPVYQALMLGTADKPGPATSMLNASRDQMAQWNAINKTGLTPAAQASLGTWNPAVSAGTSTIVDKVNQQTGKYDPIVNPALYQKDATGQYVPTTPAATAPVPGAAQGGLMGIRGYKSGGAPINYGLMAQQAAAAEAAKVKAAADEKERLAAIAKNSPYSLTDTLKKVAYFDPTTGKSTLPDFLAIQKKARELGTPDQYAKGTDAYNQALAATQALQAYSPENIAAQQADVATMQGAGPASADQLTQYQMQGPNAVNAPTAGTNQMAGPQSWLDQGTAASYMSPYQQNVTDIQKREADRAYKQQANELNAQAVKSGAFGGSRQAIQQAEAARNQNMLLNDIQAKGSQDAYTSGMGQFNAAQGQQMQAGQANLTTAQQTTLANQAAQIQAMMANQGMDYNTAVQNLQAQMGIQNTQAGQDLQAALANQGVQQQTQTANMAAQNMANQQYATQNLAAQQANQSAGLQANQQNLGTAQQLGTIGQGLAGIGTAQNATQLANLGAQGQVAQAEQNLGQSYLDAQSGNATSWLNAPTAINAGTANVLNAQPVAGGTTSTVGTTAPAHWARGGLIKNGKVSKVSKGSKK
jgi:hypothetical protein